MRHILRRTASYSKPIGFFSLQRCLLVPVGGCGDLVIGTGAHIRCDGKDRKERSTPLRRETVKVLEAWLKERGGSAGDPLFPTIRGGKLSRDALERIVHRHILAAAKTCPSLVGKRVSPHVLQHSRAMDLLHHGEGRELKRSQHAPRRTGQTDHMFGIPDGSVGNGYVKRGRKPGRRTDFMNDPAVIARREKALARMAAAAAGVEVPTPINVDAVDPADSGRASGRLDDVLAFLTENSSKQREASLP